MKITNCLLGIAVLVSLVGCESLGKNYLPDRLTKSDGAGLTITQAAYIEKDVINLSKVDWTLVTGTGVQNVAARRVLVANMISLSDQKCEIHKATIYSNSANWNIGTGVAAILLAGYASVASSAVDASRAAALAAATLGIQGQVNQEVYQAQISTAIIRAIDNSRSPQYVGIIADVGRSDVTIDELIMKVNKYHASCSLLNGLNILTAAIDNQKPSEIQRKIEADSIENEITKLEAKKTATSPPLDVTDTANLAALKNRRQALLFPDK